MESPPPAILAFKFPYTAVQFCGQLELGLYRVTVSACQVLFSASLALLINCFYYLLHLNVMCFGQIKFDLIGNVSSRQATCVALYTVFKLMIRRAVFIPGVFIWGKGGRRNPPPKKK